MKSSNAKRTAPPVNGTTLPPPGALVLVSVESVVLVTGMGNGAVVDDSEEVYTGTAAAGVEDAGGVDVDGVEDAGGVEDGRGDVAVLEGLPTATVWPGMKPAGRVMPFCVAHVAGSSP